MSIELDSSIKLCLKYLHSSAADSTEQLRLTLDELIRSTHGASKTLGATLPKKYLQEEKIGSPRGRQKAAPKTVAPPTQSPQQLQIPERSDDSGDELPFDLFDEDLTCAVCRQIAVQAGNRLVECDSCHALYHQDCHKPPISDNDMSSGWQCAACLTAQGFSVTSFSGKSVSIRSSPTRVSSSAKAGSSSAAKVVTPNINIISVDKRLQIMKKKAAKQQEKRKHSK